MTRAVALTRASRKREPKRAAHLLTLFSSGRTEGPRKPRPCTHAGEAVASDYSSPSRSSFGCFTAFTSTSTFSIFPSFPMTYVLRLENAGFFGITAPYAFDSSPSVSQRSENGNENFFLNAAFASGLSCETPRMTTPFFSNSE